MEKMLLVLGGATGSGKTALAIGLAKAYPQLVILSADSRQVYRRLDVGSAKVGAAGTNSELTGGPEPVWHADGVPQFLIDIAEPGRPYSLFDYQAEAYRLIRAAWDKDRIPFLVGGTGLYLQAVSEGYVLGASADEPLRQNLESWSLSTLQHKLHAVGGSVPEPELANKRRVIRAIERAVEGSAYGEPQPITKNVHTFVLEREWEAQRLLAPDMVQERLDLGLVAETKQLLDTGIDRAWLESMGLSYRLVLRMLTGEFSEGLLKEKMVTEFRQLMRRQRTWFNRMPQAQKGEKSIIEEAIQSILRASE